MSNQNCCGGGCHANQNHQASGCGGCGGGCGGASTGSNSPLEVQISEKEEAFFQKLAQSPFLPVAKFLMKSVQPEELGDLELAPVFLESGAETLEEIKFRGHTLLQLEHKSLISIDYDSPLEGSDRNLYHNSDAFAQLQKTVNEGKSSGEFLFDGPSVILGSICLTALGDLVLEQLDFV